MRNIKKYNNNSSALTVFAIVMLFSASMGCRPKIDYYLDCLNAEYVIPQYEWFYIVDTIKINNPFFFSVRGVDYVTDDTVGLANADARTLRDYVSPRNTNDYYIVDDFRFSERACSKYRLSLENPIVKTGRFGGYFDPEYIYTEKDYDVCVWTPKTQNDSTKFFVLALMNVAIYNSISCIDCDFQRHVSCNNPYNYYLKLAYPISIADSSRTPQEELNKLKAKGLRTKTSNR